VFRVSAVIGRPRFDFLVESDQKILKVGIQRINVFNKVGMTFIALKKKCEDNLASSLVVTLDKTLNGIAPTFEVRLVGTSGSLTRRPKISWSRYLYKYMSKYHTHKF